MTPTPTNGQDVQPFLQEAFIALKDFDISVQVMDPNTGNPVFDEAGQPRMEIVTRKAGSKVPEAADWPNLESMIRTGFIERQRDADRLMERIIEIERRLDALEGKEEIAAPVAKPTISRRKRVTQ